MNTVFTSMSKGASQVLALVRAVTLVVITVVLTAFTIQNLAPFEIRFAVWRLEAPGAVLVFVVFVLGAIFGWIAGAIGAAGRGTQATANQ